MTTIEPTQEQRDAALAFCGHHDTYRRSLTSEQGYIVSENTVAEFLAEREALAVGRAMKSHADALGGDAVGIAIQSAVGRAMRDLVDELGGDVMGRATATAAEVRAMCDLHEQRAIDALTKRNAALLVDKDDLSRQLRRVEEDRDAAHAEVAALKARAEKAEERAGNAWTAHKHMVGEVLALKAKLAEVEGEGLIIAKPLEFLSAHEREDGLWVPRGDFASDPIRTLLPGARDADNCATLPAGAGTEWAAPIAAVDEKRGTP